MKVWDFGERDTFNWRNCYGISYWWDPKYRPPNGPSREALEGNPFTRPLRGRDDDVCVPLIGNKK